MRTSTAAGKRFPINCTAVGKSILAGISSEELNEKLGRLEFVKCTESTICDREEFEKQIEIVKKRGYSEDFEELEVGLVCVAAPIYNYLGSAFAAISVSGPKHRMNEDFRREISEILVEYTMEISRKLGYTQ